MSKGIQTLKTFMESHARYGYPKIVEISANKVPFKVDKKDENFFKPIDSLTKTYA